MARPTAIPRSVRRFMVFRLAHVALASPVSDPAGQRRRPGACRAEVAESSGAGDRGSIADRVDVVPRRRRTTLIADTTLEVNHGRVPERLGIPRHQRKHRRRSRLARHDRSVRHAHRRGGARAYQALHGAPLGADHRRHPQRDPGRRLDDPLLLGQRAPRPPLKVDRRSHHRARGGRPDRSGDGAVRHHPRQPAHGEGESVARYKNWMRAAYVVYLLATVLGVVVYVRLYG